MIEKLVYLCHEYGGNSKNAELIKALHVELSLKHPEILFISPVQAVGHLYFHVPYEKGMEYCLTLLDLCDEMWTFGERSLSEGCRIEKEYCARYRIPIVEKG